jgi:RNA polymerase subunit RPABC4/transcription elongation factor Spt4
MKHCINCGEEIADDAEVCPNCGVNQSTRLESGYEDRGENEKYCVNCGALIHAQAEMCPDCGFDQPSLRGGTIRDTDQLAAGLLAILLGSFGVHKFYQGNTRNGLLYLCFFWTTIPALLGLIEGILILVADEDEYREKWADGSILGR